MTCDIRSTFEIAMADFADKWDEFLSLSELTIMEYYNEWESRW